MISIDIFESLESEFCPHCDSPSECQVDEEMEKAASTPSARPESNGLDWTQWTGLCATWIEFNEFEAESES